MVVLALVPRVVDYTGIGGKVEKTVMFQSFVYSQWTYGAGVVRPRKRVVAEWFSLGENPT
ncbi:hypothetical protein J6590_052720 [Homalodisca vitripennis]|nr:hypothetical protein J6590_052720 [Homalodisca vitripennis]